MQIGLFWLKYLECGALDCVPLKSLKKHSSPFISIIPFSVAVGDLYLDLARNFHSNNGGPCQDVEVETKFKQKLKRHVSWPSPKDNDVLHVFSWYIPFVRIIWSWQFVHDIPGILDVFQQVYQQSKGSKLRGKPRLVG